MTAKARSLIAMLGALVYALFGFRILFSSAASVVDARQSIGRFSDSEGIGAVSIGISELMVTYGLLWLGSIAAHRMLRPWVRGSEGATKTLHRTHLWMIVLPFVVAILVPVTFLAHLAAVSQLLFSISGVVWGAQFVLTAALLAAYAVRTSRT